MAKSTGNIARPGELFEAGVSPRALRYALLAVHYRAGLNSLGRIAGRGGGRAVERLDALVAALAAYREDRADDPTLPDALADGRGERSARRSTTTSTCPRRWLRCSTSSAS